MRMQTKAGFLLGFLVFGSLQVFKCSKNFTCPAAARRASHQHSARVLVLMMAQTTTIELVVPEGVVAGQLIQAEAPGSGPVQVIVPAGLAAGDKFEVRVQQVDGAAVAARALAQLGELGSSITFRLISSQISSAGGMVNQTIVGELPVLDAAGTDVLRLAFESSRRGKHLHATLILRDGTKVASLDMGVRPNSTAKGYFNSVVTSYTSIFSPPPPVQLSVLGQAYGSYTVNSYMNCQLQGGARWSRTDGTAVATIDEPAHVSCCFCCDAGQSIPRKASVLGKKEVPMTACFSVGAGPAVCESRMHLVTDSREGRMREPHATNVRNVVCELDAIRDPRQKLDTILIGASLAALNVTTAVPSK